MTQIEQAIAQIAELKAQLPKGACAAQIAMESLCKDEAYNEAIGILKTLLNEQNHANSAKTCKDLQESVSEDLEQAAIDYDSCRPALYGEDDEGDYVEYIEVRKDAFIAGAQWQKERDQKELQIAEEHGILTGMNMEREKMMKDTIEATALNSDYPTRIELNTKLNNINAMDEVKVIIIKE